MGGVSALLRSMGAPPEAIDWGEGYGNDMRRAWGECVHPELLLPMAVGAGVSDEVVINGTIEVARACLEGMEHTSPLFELLMRLVERFLCRCETTDWEHLERRLDEINRALMKAGEYERAQVSSLGAAAHIVQATMLAEKGIMRAFQSRLSTAVMLAAQARAEELAQGLSEEAKGIVIEKALQRTAVLARSYVPYETLTGGFIAIADFGVTGEEAKTPSA